MARLSDLLGSTKKQDLLRVARDERVPYRGRKKHYTQMSKSEKDYLSTSLKAVKRWEMEYHSLDRIRQKGIEATYDDIASTVYNGEIIEYHIGRHNDKRDNRVLLRAKAIVNRRSNLNVVYSLTRKKIVSVWLNDIEDRHETLDMSMYSRNLKIR